MCAAKGLQRHVSWLILTVLCVSIHGAPDVEMRGLWMATVDNIDWPSVPELDVTSQQQQLEVYLDLMAETHLNCLFFQVGPVGDAFYNSSIEPWSVYLTGTQGEGPSPFWDPLQFVTSLAHQKGIQVHAWINPFRAKYNDNSTEGLAPSHMARRFPQYAYPYGNMLWMDPAADVVREHTLSVANDILTRYDVDGLHIDDYYYPYPQNNLTFPDNGTYQEYIDAGGSLNLADWRHNNVNTLVSMLSDLVRGHERTFSISPMGFYRPGEPGGQPPPISGYDPYSKIYADSKLWLEKGWMDWFIPQLYFAISPPEQSYTTKLDWWLDVSYNSTRKPVFAGVALFKIAPPFNWNLTEIENQVQVSRDDARRGKGSLGNVHFTANILRNNTKNAVETYKLMYPNVATVPNNALSQKHSFYSYWLLILTGLLHYT